jgi:hypothetical protein
MVNSLQAPRSERDNDHTYCKHEASGVEIVLMVIVAVAIFKVLTRWLDKKPQDPFIGLF